MEDRPDIKPSRNILFHFNPRPSSRIILNSCLKGKWQDELTIEGTDLDGMLLQKPFDLTIKILSVKDAKNACENKSEFEVYLNDVFLTTFRSPLPITATKFIGFSPCIRICKSSKSVYWSNKKQNAWSKICLNLSKQINHILWKSVRRLYSFISTFCLKSIICLYACSQSFYQCYLPLHILLKVSHYMHSMMFLLLSTNVKISESVILWLIDWLVRVLSRIGNISAM